jgi:hypothetical protein
MRKTPRVLAEQRPHAWHVGSRFDPESPGFRRGLFVSVARASIRTPNWNTRTINAFAGAFSRVPRSPGWQPGDSGHENHHACHAARRSETAATGEHDGQRPPLQGSTTVRDRCYRGARRSETAATGGIGTTARDDPGAGLLVRGSRQRAPGSRVRPRETPPGAAPARRSTAAEGRRCRAGAPPRASR